jgi:hypothetical protein
MFINLLFPDIVKREKEEYKQLMNDLHSFIKLCKKPRKGKQCMEGFKVTEKEEDLKKTEGDIALLKIESSHIKAIGNRGKNLFVAFNTGDVYKYNNVPYQLFLDMQKAESKGKYFNLFIRKGGYSYSKVAKIK